MMMIEEVIAQTELTQNEKIFTKKKTKYEKIQNNTKIYTTTRLQR